MLKKLSNGDCITDIKIKIIFWKYEHYLTDQKVCIETSCLICLKKINQWMIIYIWKNNDEAIDIISIVPGTQKNNMKMNFDEYQKRNNDIQAIKNKGVTND